MRDIIIEDISHNGLFQHLHFFLVEINLEIFQVILPWSVHLWAARSVKVLLKVWPSSSLQRSMNRWELVFNGGHWSVRKLRREHPIEVDGLLSLLSIGFWKHNRWLFGISEPSTVASFWCQFYVKLVLVQWVNYSFRSFGIAHDVDGRPGWLADPNLWTVHTLAAKLI